jgi:hypothetical protein
MKKLVLILILLTGCVPNYKYVFNMEKPVPQKENWYRDSLIYITFNIDNTRVNFTLQNLTNNIMKIIWDESALILDSKTERILHSGVRYIESNNPQIPTIVIPKAFLSDLMTPIDNIHFINVYEVGWQVSPLFHPEDRTKDKGKNFQVLLTIEQEKKYNYIFDFKIADIIEEKP